MMEILKKSGRPDNSGYLAHNCDNRTQVHQTRPISRMAQRGRKPLLR